MGWRKKEPETASQIRQEPVLVQEVVQPRVVEQPRPEPRLEPRSSQVQNQQVKERWQVVKELPLQPIREIKDEDGTIVHFITLEEALTMQMND